MWISWVENVVNMNVCPIIQVILSMCKSIPVDLEDVHIAFCCGVAQSSSPQAAMQSTPPG